MASRRLCTLLCGCGVSQALVQTVPLQASRVNNSASMRIVSYGKALAVYRHARVVKVIHLTRIGPCMGWKSKSQKGYLVSQPGWQYIIIIIIILLTIAEKVTVASVFASSITTPQYSALTCSVEYECFFRCWDVTGMDWPSKSLWSGMPASSNIVGTRSVWGVG